MHKYFDFKRLREIMKQEEIPLWKVSEETGISIGILNHLARGIKKELKNQKKKDALISFINKHQK